MSLNIGLLGCGTIGYQVALELISKKFENLNLKKILVKDSKKIRENIDKSLFTTKAEEILQDPNIDLIVEVLGNEQPALDYVLTAINQKKHVVTANKELMAKHGKKIFSLALEQGVHVQMEAAVAGGIPVINTVQNDLKANHITEIIGILNGTTNYILSEMKGGEEFEEALKQAQEKGYAEPDPTNDLEGYDSKYKISILASLAFRKYISPDSVSCVGIRSISKKDFDLAKEMGFSIKLLGRAKLLNDKSLSINVSPYLISLDNPLSQVDGVLNAVEIKGDLVGELMLIGAGAGPKPTASSILGDILTIKNKGHKVFLPYNCKESFVITDKNISKFYLRLEVNDEKGVIRDIGCVLAENGLSIEAIVQKKEIDSACLTLITHEIEEALFFSSLKSVEKLSSVKKISSNFRVL